MTRINSNIPALVAARILNQHNVDLGRTLNRLSTGLRINTGKDDPAGLIASEKLRSELRATSSAIENANRADLIVGIAEGGLEEVSALLLDLEDLVVRTSNESGLSDQEVVANQLQLDSILQSLTRISDSVAYAGKKLLNGNLDFTTSNVTAANVTDLSVTAAKRSSPTDYKNVVVEVTASAQLAGLYYSATTGPVGSSTTIQVRGNLGSDVVTFASSTSLANIATLVNNSKDSTGVSAVVSAAENRVYFYSTSYGSDQFASVAAIDGTFTTRDKATTNLATEDSGVDATVLINGGQANTKGLVATLTTGSLALSVTLTSTFGTQTASTETFQVTGGGALFHLTPEVGLAGQVSLGLGSVAPGLLGTATDGYLSTLGSGQTNELSSKNFATAQRILRSANTQVSSLRGRLGAFQKNTLETTINSLNVTFENVTAAESAIRDAEFASETSYLMRKQILVQSTTAALQLANAQPQNVLALLG